MDIEIDSREFRAALGRLARESMGAAVRALNAIGAEQRDTTAARIRPHSSRLARSLQVSRATKASPEVRIGSALPWARITHFGGTVTAPGANTADNVGRRVPGRPAPRMLTVPLTRLGTPRGARAKDYPGLFVLKAKSGKLYLAQRTQEFGSVKRGKSFRAFAGRRRAERGPKGAVKRGFRLLFALIESVKVAARPYLYWSGQDVASAQDTVKRELERVVTK